MLRDIGWEVSDGGFPPSCVPTGVSVTPTSGLVTTEGGGTAAFRVKLESEPISEVIIPLRSSHPSEGTADTRALSFTPDDWEVAKTVTVTGMNDSEEDGARSYAIVLDRAQSQDRFYDGFDPDDVSLTNRDNDPEPDTPSPPGEGTGQGGSGCAIAAEGAGAGYVPKRDACPVFARCAPCFRNLMQKPAKRKAAPRPDGFSPWSSEFLLVWTTIVSVLYNVGPRALGRKRN